jgi:hypothetical protein
METWRERFDLAKSFDHAQCKAGTKFSPDALMAHLGTGVGKTRLYHEIAFQYLKHLYANFFPDRRLHHFALYNWNSKDYKESVNELEKCILRLQASEELLQEPNFPEEPYPRCPESTMHGSTAQMDQLTDDDGKAVLCEESIGAGDDAGEALHTDAGEALAGTDTHVAVPVVGTGVCVPAGSRDDAVAGDTVRFADTLPFLNDESGFAHGTIINLQGEDQNLIQMLEGAYNKANSRKGCFGAVQTYTPQIKQCRLKSSGFLVQEDGFMFKGPFYSSMSDFEGRLSELIQKALMSIGYCSEEQKVHWYLSFLRSESRKVQRPHIDFKWDDITPPVEGVATQSRAFHGNYKEWVPFIALFPISEAGMTIEIWHARNDHQCKLEEKGVLVKIEPNSILLLRADVIHAG